ncbi:MAG: ribonuclease P protein component [Planktomarina sp.]
MDKIIEPDETSSLGLLSFSTLKQRKDFLRTARGKRAHVDGFVIQGWNRGDADVPRIGYTCSKKVGNAVARNRAKRRLRAIARDTMPGNMQQGWDYVLIGRPKLTADLPYTALQSQLRRALQKIHK